MKEFTWKPRGLGCPRKYTKTGEWIENDCSGFVDSKEDGEKILKMIQNLVSEEAVKGKGCFVSGDEVGFLDYREYEPNWIQLKIFASNENKKNLQVLYLICSKDNTISEDRVLIAKNKEIVKEISNEYYTFLNNIHELNREDKVYSYDGLKKELYEKIDLIIDLKFYKKSKKELLKHTEL